MIQGPSLSESITSFLGFMLSFLPQGRLFLGTLRLFFAQYRLFLMLFFPRSMSSFPSVVYPIARVQICFSTSFFLCSMLPFPEVSFLSSMPSFLSDISSFLKSISTIQVRLFLFQNHLFFSLSATLSSQSLSPFLCNVVFSYLNVVSLQLEVAYFFCLF